MTATKKVRRQKQSTAKVNKVCSDCSLILRSHSHTQTNHSDSVFPYSKHERQCDTVSYDKDTQVVAVNADCV